MGITEIIQAAIALILAVLAGLGIPFAHKYIAPWLDAKTEADEARMLETVTQKAIYAAEEAARTGNIPKSGKYKYASDIIRSSGFDLSAETMAATINSEVYKQFTQYKDTEENITWSDEFVDAKGDNPCEGNNPCGGDENEPA